MARPWGRGRTPLLESRWRFVVLGGLAAFVVLDIVLVVIAAHGVAPQPATTPGPIPTYTSTPTPEPTAGSTPTPSPSATTGAGSDAAASGASSTTGPAPLISAVSATEAWRATSGTCPTSDGSTAATATVATVEHTTDGGATWSPVSLGAQAVDTVVALDGGSSRTVVVGGDGSSCAVAAAESFTSGMFWAASPSSLTSSAYIVPSASSLHLTSGAAASPCTAPESVVEGATETAVVCSDGLQVRAGAGSWSRVGVSGIVAIAPTTGSFTIARTGVKGCAGLDVESLAVPVTASSTATALGCASIADRAAPLTAATVALSRTGSDVWLWVGGKTLVSTDGGVTW
ncbi:hypothetical protein AX769_10275 [Frondihabitans sp. PAMC 28766]|uniref:hypothetical protein n=1 Tax=Frondihabitans sp. PAMC 28766 TaxID=1795630 RepID=UPI00078D4A98|nr:hypothetical protein [Frondihabitans sp. PAMC 28766]AMM20462.1 hypothetical protein AX769_10275 [Frondihabitans sp. PAMC 28766]